MSAGRNHRCGLPRPRAKFSGYGQRTRELPVPWIIQVKLDGDPVWNIFHDEIPRAHIERLCQVCGKKLGYTVFLGAALREWMTSGPACHPICMQLAIRFCPHLSRISDTGVVAYAYQGKGTGYEMDLLSATEHDIHAVIDEAFQHELAVSDCAIPVSRITVAEVTRSDPMGIDEELKM